jgi:hypothetical protein
MSLYDWDKDELREYHRREHEEQRRLDDLGRPSETPDFDGASDDHRSAGSHYRPSLPPRPISVGQGALVLLLLVGGVALCNSTCGSLSWAELSGDVTPAYRNAMAHPQAPPSNDDRTPTASVLANRAPSPAQAVPGSSMSIPEGRTEIARGPSTTPTQSPVSAPREVAPPVAVASPTASKPPIAPPRAETDEERLLRHADEGAEGGYDVVAAQHPDDWALCARLGIADNTRATLYCRACARKTQSASAPPTTPPRSAPSTEDPRKDPSPEEVRYGLEHALTR